MNRTGRALFGSLCAWSLAAGAAVAAPAQGAALNQSAAPSVRTLTVTNAGTAPVWIGGSGGSVVPACRLPDGTACLADPSRTANGACSCDASQPKNGTLACPPDSTATSDGKFCTCTPSDPKACGGAQATTACASSTTPNRCFWNLPSPATHGKSKNPWQLLPKETATFELPLATDWGSTASPVTTPVWWSGGIFGRTLCQADGTRCATGDCGAKANQNCPPGVGGSNPFSQAEFTLQSGATDFYDVTVINGVSTAVAMAPKGKSAPAGGGHDATYWCQAAGGGPGVGGAGSCSWKVDPVVPNGAGGGTDQSTLLLHSWLPCDATKTPSGCPQGLQCSGAPGACFKACSTAQDCPGSLACTGGYCQCAKASDCAGLGLPAGEQQCGTQLVPGVGRFLQQCGSFAGWWTADDFCGLVDSYGPLDCTAPIQDGNGTSTTNLRSLFLCTGANAASCYNTTAGDTTCCGCATDAANPLAKDWPLPATGEKCFGNNTTWAKQVQPWLVHLKKACPTAYTYPFDDATSTFQCQSAAGPLNSQDYTITLKALTAP